MLDVISLSKFFQPPELLGFLNFHFPESFFKDLSTIQICLVIFIVCVSNLFVGACRMFQMSLCACPPQKNTFQSVCPWHGRRHSPSFNQFLNSAQKRIDFIIASSQCFVLSSPPPPVPHLCRFLFLVLQCPLLLSCYICMKNVPISLFPLQLLKIVFSPHGSLCNFMAYIHRKIKKKYTRKRINKENKIQTPGEKTCNICLCTSGLFHLMSHCMCFLQMP